MPTVWYNIIEEDFYNILGARTLNYISQDKKIVASTVFT